MKHNLFSRFISVLLAVVMLAGLMSMPSLADTVTGTDTAATDNVNITEDDTEVDSAPAALSEEDGEGDKEPADSDESSEPTDDAETTGDVQEPEEGTEDTQEPADTTGDTVGTDDTQEPADTTGDEADNTVASVNTYAGMTAAELSDAIMACQSVDEAKELVAKLTEDEMSAYLTEIGSEKEEELESHIADLYNAEEPEEPAEAPAEDSSESESDEYEEHVPEIVPAPVSPVPFTNAVPMFESVPEKSTTDNSAASPAKSSRLAAPLSLFSFDNYELSKALNNNQDENPSDGDVKGLNLEKSVKDNGNGTYTIDLSVWTEGTVTTSQTTKPVDIVLVLDQSGSMENDFVSVRYEKFTNQTAGHVYRNNRNNTYVKLSDGSYSKVTINNRQEISDVTYQSMSNSANGTLYNRNIRNNLYYLDDDGEYYKVNVSREWIPTPSWDDWFDGHYEYTYSATNGKSWTSDGEDTIPECASDFYTSQTTYKSIYNFTYTDENAADRTVTMDSDEIAQTAFASSESGKELYYTTNGGTEHRLDALTTAVDEFIDSVAEKAKGADEIAGTADDVHHRIAIVGYSSDDYNNTELLTGVPVARGGYEQNQQNKYYPDNYQYNGPQYYDEWGLERIDTDDYKASLQDVASENGYKNVQQAVDYLTAHGGTQTDAGMDMANQIFKNNPVNQQERDRVVILFTDGIPTGSGNSYSSTVANRAIKYANTAKNTYGAKVYAIGIFDGANPKSSGNQSGNETAKGNYFMQNVSSNNGTPQNPSYYLAASNSTELNQIFNAISQTTGSSSVNLDTKTIVADAVTQYFQIVQPEGTDLADSIDVSVQKYDGEDFTTYEAAPGSVQVTVTQDNKVQVTGYDFAKKFISENGRDEQDPNKTGEYYGERLCISFNIEPKAEFWGGNEVPTNITDESGVIDDGEMLEKFPVPDPVDVPLKEITLTPKNLNIYYGNTAPSAGDLVNDIEMPDDWRTDYVNDVTFTTIEESISNTADGTYHVTATLSPKYDGTVDAETATPVMAKVNVFKPIVTWKDTTLEANADVDSNFTDNMYSEAWKHNETDSSTVQMEGTKPALTFAFELNDGNNIPTNITTELLVKVKSVTSSNEADLNVDPAVISYGWVENDSSDGCTDACVDPNPDYQFRVHVGSCELVITKTITGLDNLSSEKWDEYKNGLIFTYTNKADSTDTGSITLAKMDYNKDTDQYTYTFDGLKVGATYTVSESGYTVQDYDFTGTWEKTIKTQAGENQVGFANAYTWNPKGKLTVSKTLNNFNSTMGKDAIFQFEVKATDGAYKDRVWYVNLTFDKADTATADLTGLPVGTYTVKELNSAGYTLVGDSDSQTITISPDGTSPEVASFTNDKAGDNTPGDQDIVRNNFTYDSATGVWKFTQENN